MSGYYIGIDVGTTGMKGVLIDSSGEMLASQSREQHQFFPQPGWVEQDGDELLQLLTEILRTLPEKAGIAMTAVQGIGIDHQGESCLVWDKATGKAVYPVITWQDRRMAAASDAFGAIYGEKLRELTGLRSDSYYSAWKLRWILDHIPDGQQRAENGELLCGTLNTWFIWKLTGGKAFVTDEGSASVMMLADPRVREWNPWLLQEMNLPHCMLPEIVPCDSLMGYTTVEAVGAEIPITATLPDCSAGIVGAAAMNRGDLMVTYGTGNFMHLITGGTFVPAQEGLTSACCYASTKEKLYQLNGICYSAGSAIKWLQNSLHLIDHASETETLARSVKNTGGVYFVPALNGLATPAWDQSARGAFLGITAASERAHLVRAVLESSALQVARCCRIMRQVSGIEPVKLNAMGGMTANSFLMQLQADLTGIPVSLPCQTEPAYGIACMAAQHDPHAIRLTELAQRNPPTRIFEPKLSQAERDERIDRWSYAVERTLNWHPEEIGRN